MALIHEKLYQSQDFAQVDLGEYIHILVTYLIRSYRTTSGMVDVEIQTDEVYIDIGTAVPCGLLLNELISNALKYAFVNGRRGKITITLSAEDNQITLAVADNGVGISDEQLANSQNTLGLQLIRTLVRQIDADMSIKTDAGTKFEIKFRLPSETDTKLEEPKQAGA
jgi:two-component sensor histidine kinase